jgi:hypothetical protein
MTVKTYRKKPVTIEAMASRIRDLESRIAEIESPKNIVTTINEEWEREGLT